MGFAGFLLCVALGTLIFPGWDLTPLRGKISDFAQGHVEGLDFKLDALRVQLKGGTDLSIEARGVVLAQERDEPTLALGFAEVGIPLKRLARGRLIPARMILNTVSVRVETDESGTLILPPWILALSMPDETEVVAKAGWDDFRLGDIPLVWKIDEGECLDIRMEGYEAHLIRGAERATFALPSLHIRMEGRKTGADLHWQTRGWETNGARFVSGEMLVDVLRETITWQNEFNLPLTPDLAAWLQTGFPYLPVPGFIETVAHLHSHGEVELIPARMGVRGALALAPGSVSLPGDASLRLTIPPMQMDFASDVLYGRENHRLESQLLLRLGEGERASTIGLNAEIDGVADSIQVDSSGALRYVEDLLALLPEKMRPVAISGNFHWEVSLETRQTVPTTVRRGSIVLGSDGVDLSFAEEGRKPLRLAPFSFAGRLEHSGREVYVDPFEIHLGPLVVEGTGFHWTAGDHGNSGTGEIRLHPFAVGDLLAVLPMDEKGIDPGAIGILKATQVNRLGAHLAVSPADDASAAIGEITVSPRWDFTVYEKPVSGGGSIRGIPAETTFFLELELARFNPAGMVVPILSDIGELDSELTVGLQGRVNVNTLEIDLTGDIAAGAGTFRPASTLQPLLKPESFVFDGASVHVTAKGKQRIEGKAGIRISGTPGHLHGNLAIASVDPRNPMAEPVFATASIELNPAPTRQLLELCGPAFAAMLPLPESFLRHFDLRATRFATELQLHDNGDGISVIPENSSGLISIRTGREDLTITATPGEAHVGHGGRTIQWSSNLWNPGLSGIDLTGLLPIPLDAMQLPLRLSGEIRLPDSFALDNLSGALEQTSAAVNLNMENGHITENEFLREKLPLSSILATAEIHPNAPRLAPLSINITSTLGTIDVVSEELALADGSWAGVVEIAATGFDLKEVQRHIPHHFLPKDSGHWGEADLRGSLPRVFSRVQLGTRHPAMPLPGVSSLHYEITLAELAYLHRELPALSAERLEIRGSVDQLQLTLTEGGLSALRLERLTATIENPLRGTPGIQTTGRFRADLTEIDGVIDSLDARQHLPDWARIPGHRGTVDGSWELSGKLHETPLPDHWTLSQSLILRDVWLPVPIDELSYRGLNQDIAVEWNGSDLSLGFSGNLDDVRIGGEARGDIGVSGSLSIAAGANSVFRCDLDLTGIVTSIDLLATSKRLGESAHLRFELTAPSLENLFTHPRFDFFIGVRGLLFDHLRFNAQTIFKENFEGAWFGFESIDLDFLGMDYSDISIGILAQPQNTFDVRVRSNLLNTGPALHLLEPLLLDLIESTGDKEDRTPPKTAADPKKVDPDISDTKARFPNFNIGVDIERIQIGNIKSFGPLHLSGYLSKGLPETLRFQLRDGDHSIGLSIAPNEGLRSVDFQLTQLGHWIDVGVAPLQLLQSNRARTSELLAEIKRLSSLLDKGHIRFAGSYVLEPDFHTHLTGLSFGDVVLQTEIAFLSRIAALVDRKVTLLIPFRDFRIDSLDVTAKELVARDVIMEGPITLGLEKTSYDFGSAELHILGRVFGVPFEVIGIPPDLEFYLQERSQVIRAFTTEDDFDW